MALSQGRQDGIEDFDLGLSHCTYLYRQLLPLPCSATVDASAKIVNGETALLQFYLLSKFQVI